MMFVIHICPILGVYIRFCPTYIQDVKNRPSGQFFTSSPRYAGNVKPSLLSHDVLTSPALLDFPSKASSLGKPRKAGAR
jgi:hypothetical protein